MGLGHRTVPGPFLESQDRAVSGTIMTAGGLDETQDGIKIARRNINNLRYADDTTLICEELKSLLMKVEKESEKVGLSSTFRK